MEIIMEDKTRYDKLKALREYKHMTQAAVAAALNIKPTTYSNYETGQRHMDPETIYKLAGIFEVPLEDLMHLIIGVDEDISFDAPKKTESSEELNGLLEYTTNPNNKTKLKMLSSYETKLMYYFEKISNEDKEEIIEFTKIKSKKKA